MYYYQYETKIGKLYISANNHYLLSISYQKNNDYLMVETPLIKEAYCQISEYLNHQRKSFDLPLLISGTLFQKSVYSELSKLSFGSTISYKALGEKIDKPNSARAVGNACNKNPFVIVIPCHRVISSSNKLTGYAGGIEVKEALLSLEGVKVYNDLVILD